MRTDRATPSYRRHAHRAMINIQWELAKPVPNARDCVILFTMLY